MLPLLSWLLLRVPTVCLAEAALTMILKPRAVGRRLFWIVGSSLLCFVAASNCGLLRPVKFGFSLIPFLLTDAPWRVIPFRLQPSALTTDATQLFCEVVFCCVLFILSSRLGYPKHSTKISGRHATT